jgi:hypothetical protein
MNSENINNQSRSSSNEISLKDLFSVINKWYKYLLTKWIVIVFFGLAGGVLGFFYASSRKAVYTARTTFVLEDGEKVGGLGQYAGLASMVGIDLGGGGGIFQGDNILELYKSRKMIEKTLLSEVEFNGEKLLLIDRYIEFNKLRKAWSKTPDLKNIQFRPKTSDGNKLVFSRLQDSVMSSIITEINTNNLNVSKPDKKLSLIKAEVKSIDEFFSKSFNEQIVKNVNDFYIQTKTKRSLDNVTILQQKTDSVRNIMNGAIYASAAVSDATPNLNPTRQIQRIAPMQRSQFNAETNKSILSELVKNLEMSKIALRKETPLVQVIDEPVYPLDKSKFGKLKGIILGGFLGGFLIVLLLISRKALKEDLV